MGSLNDLHVGKILPSRTQNEKVLSHKAKLLKKKKIPTTYKIYIGEIIKEKVFATNIKRQD